MSLTGQTHYLLLTATVFAIFPSRSGYIDQSGNPARHHRTCQTLSPPSQGVWPTKSTVCAWQDRQSLWL